MHQLLADAFLMGSTSGINQQYSFDLPNQAMSLVLMNIALIMLAVDLLAHELKTPSLPLFWA